MNKTYSLTYDKRLHRPADYRRFFEGSELLRLRHCLVFRIHNALGHFRLGITLKSRGSSIERNLIKRTIRECVRLHAPSLGSYDYNVVVPKGRKLTREYAQQLRFSLENELKDVLTHRSRDPR